MELDSSFDYAKKYLGIYYVRNGQLDKAVQHYGRMIKENPGRGDYFTGLVAVYREANELGEALNSVDNGISECPDERDLYAYGFQIAMGLGNSALANAYIDKWLVRYPNDPEFSSLSRKLEEEADDKSEIDSIPDSVK
jgi:tetratricopeptide (TPR) repeat protein